MKSYHLLFPTIALMLTSCVIVRPTDIFLQNATMQPITARLHYREWLNATDTVHLRYQTIFAQGLRYSPLLLPPSQKIIEQLTATLSVSATDTAAIFIIPPHSTVLLQTTTNFHLPPDVRLYLQQVGATTCILDEEQLMQAGHFGEGCFWYSINN
ncbi:MAG: hypothetical protein EOO61_10005 [Hymenobacter sp.]|nr:MAG: hypothetical protein EOO61_10005 [Hymenobacter sp.]